MNPLILDPILSDGVLIFQVVEEGRPGFIGNGGMAPKASLPLSMIVHFIPKHCSWLNQIEIWFSILVRKLLRRGNFTSQADLKAKILSFIEYFNRTMAKPFKWTYTGKPLIS